MERNCADHVVTAFYGFLQIKIFCSSTHRFLLNLQTSVFGLFLLSNMVAAIELEKSLQLKFKIIEYVGGLRSFCERENHERYSQSGCAIVTNNVQ